MNDPGLPIADRAIWSSTVPERGNVDTEIAEWD
jgi:hypothetical protein